MLADLWQDIRYGAQMLIRQPGFTLVAILTLALGIGANGAIFSLVNALLLRPLPVAKPDELAAVYTADYSSGHFGTSSYPDYVDFRNRNQSFSDLVAYMPRPFSLSVDGSNERAFGEVVSGNYFSALGIPLALGRGFLPDEDKTPGSHPVVVISHSLWQTRFAGDPAIAGRSLKLNGQSFTVIGVAEKGFSGMLRGFGADLWVPSMMGDQVSPGSHGLTERGDRSLMIMGRLKPGVTLAQAQAEFRTIGAQLFKEWPDNWTNIRQQPRPITMLPESESRVFPGFRMPLLLFATMLMTVVGLVLLIACANVANLLLARSSARRREIAIRLSLGAGRWRVIRQLITESLMLAVVGGLVGLVITIIGSRLLATFKPPVEFPVAIDLGADWRVFGFTFAISLLTGVLFGLAPALATTHPDLVESLKEESGSGILRHRRGRLRGILVVVQVALSLLLLISSGLFLRSLSNASSIDPGFEADNVLAMSMDLRLQGYDEAKGRAFSQAMLERVRVIPGVQSAGLAEYLPLGFGGSRRGMRIEGYTAQPGESTEIHSANVGPGYFETLRVKLAKGRTFNEQDRVGSPGVVVINEAFARRYWPGQDAIGKRIQMGGNTAPYLEVIGIVEDGKYETLGEEATPFVYLNLGQRYEAAPTLVVRTKSNPLEYLAGIRNEIATLDKNLPLYDVKTMRQHLGIALLPARLAGSVLGVFGLVALVLAAAGIYGVMAYSVAQRTREIGVRRAIGAQNGDILRLVLTQGVILTLIGIGIGLVAAFALTRLLTSLLYGISPTDPLTFASIVILLLAIALLACVIPVWRATRVSPLVALRGEG